MLSLDEAPTCLTPTDRINKGTWNKQNSSDLSLSTARNKDAPYKKSPPQVIRLVYLSVNLTYDSA